MAAEISVFIFWTVFLAALWTNRLWVKSENPISHRLNRLFYPNASSGVTFLEPSVEPMKRTLQLGRFETKSNSQSALRFKRICRAVPLVLIVFSLLMGFPIAQVFAVGALSTTIFILIPRLLVFRAVFKRRSEIERNLSDALDLLILCLEAGLSFDSSLVRVAKEVKRVSSYFSDELMLTNQEILAGESR